MEWKTEVRECKERHARVNGIELCWFEWGDKGDEEETILLVHATGFHARCWDQTIRYLGDKHIISIDMRGHGRSEKNGPYSWENFGADVTALIRHLDLDRIIGAGHSMGGHSLTQSMADEPQRFLRAVLVDPVIMSPELYLARTSDSGWLNDSEQHPVARRRNEFADADAMFQNFKGRGSYQSWQDEALHDYCEFGLLENPDGDNFVLACPPLVEASIYMGSASENIFENLGQIKVPMTVLRAKQKPSDLTEMDFSYSPTWDGLADQFESGRDVYLPELTHFMPMQAPELVAGYILGTS